METQFDVIIVGGGIGGSALASGLARAGLAVEVLEREMTFSDRVRGEWMAPWGVAESRRLDVFDTLREAGGHIVTRGINYDEMLSTADAEAAAMAIDEIVPDAPGAMCMEHVAMQNALIGLASETGACVRRGVEDVSITPGPNPSVTFGHDGRTHRHGCRLIVGADGRTSRVRRQLGLALDEQPIDHLVSGLLVDGVDEWPDDVQSIGKAGDVMYLVFPQGGGKIRLYVDYGMENRGRFTGEAGAKNLLAAFDTAVLPHGDAIARARPIGPCKAFPSQDAPLDTPYADGAVLIGDAAGFTDPIFGQGLSITLRDVRIVRDTLLNESTWSAETFEPYAAERRERIRRAMCATRFGTTMFARFDEEAIARRARAMARMADDPSMTALLGAAFAGPERFPDEVFTDAYYDRLFAP